MTPSVKMKTIVTILVLGWSFLSVTGQRKLAEDDPVMRQKIVQRAFDEVSAGMYSSWSEKELARLGDSAAPEIMRLIGARNLTMKDTQTALSLVNMSFAYPRIITTATGRTTANTLALLDYLDTHSLDNETKRKINSVREHIKGQAFTK